MKKLIAILASVCILWCGCAGFGMSIKPVLPGLSDMAVVIDPATGKLELSGMPYRIGVEVAIGADVPPMAVPVK